jgi:hypothetical protein
VVEVVTVDCRRFNQSNILPNNISTIPLVLLRVRASSAKAALLAATKTGSLEGSSRSLVALNTGNGMAVPPYSSARYFVFSR